MRFTGRLPVIFALFLWMAGPALAMDSIPDSSSLDELLAAKNADSGSKKTLVLNPAALEARYRLAVGLSYTGGQVRYQFSPRWAAEARYQFGSAGSNFGDVHANVFGLRGYRFMPFRPRLAWYLGGEWAYADTTTREYNYETKGFALGGFGGMEYRVLPRLAISTDIGPYMIELKEKLSGLNQTGLDFVVNTAVNVYLF